MKTLVAAVLCAALTVTTQTLEDAAVEAAVKAGQSNKYKELISNCSAGPGFGAGMTAAMAGGVQPTGYFNVIVSRAAGRIAYLAADAKRLYKPFAVADVSQELRSDSTVFVTVVPDKPKRNNNTIDVASPIDHVVLRGPNAMVVQPTNTSLTPMEWSNLMGGKVEANSAVATFEAAAVSNLPAGDIDVVVITAAGERRCKVGRGDRARLFSR